jgi:hypothetical protein
MSGCSSSNQLHHTGVKSNTDYYVKDNAGNNSSINVGGRVIVTSFDCNPYRYVCGTRVSGYYYANCKTGLGCDCSRPGQMVDCHVGHNGKGAENGGSFSGGGIWLHNDYCSCDTRYTYANVYCTAYNTCYK